MLFHTEPRGSPPERGVRPNREQTGQLGTTENQGLGGSQEQKELGAQTPEFMPAMLSSELAPGPHFTPAPPHLGPRSCEGVCPRPQWALNQSPGELGAAGAGSLGLAEESPL